MGKKGDKQMSHFIRALHMPLTLPVMQPPRTGRKPAAGGEGRAGGERDPERGAAPRPLWARPRGPSARSGCLAAPAPGRPEQPLQTSAGAEFPGGRRGAPACAPPLAAHL